MSTPVTKTFLREKWAADVARRKADALAGIDDRQAEDERLTADLADAHADLAAEYECARQAMLFARTAGDVAHARALVAWADGGSSGPAPSRSDFGPAKDDPVVAKSKALAADLHTLRKTWRSLGEATGKRHLLAVRNNVTDPTDAELAVWWAEQMGA